MSRDPAFEVRLQDDARPRETLVVGLADVGLAGLTAVDYLVSQGEFEQIGHVSTRNLPDIAPFSDGEPRHPIRLFNAAAAEVTVLVSEVFVPVAVADLVVDALLEWATANGVESLGVVHGVPFPHDEAEHTVFHVATEQFRERHLAETGVQPLAGGFFDGAVAEFVVRAMDGEGPPTGVLVTPSHPPGPDFDGAITLLEGVETVFDIEVDTGALQQRLDETNRYYQQLADRMRALQDSEASVRSRDFPEDRMFM